MTLTHIVTGSGTGGGAVRSSRAARVLWYVCGALLALVVPGVAQVTSLDGSVTASMDLTHLGESSGDVTRGSAYRGALTLRGSGYMIDRDILDANFRFSVRGGIANYDGHAGSSSSRDRSIDWYAVDSRFLRWGNSGFTFSSSLTEANVSDVYARAGISQYVPLLKGTTQLTSIGSRIDLDSYGWVTATASQGITRFAGFTSDSSVGMRRLNVQYGQTGEGGENISVRYDFNDVSQTLLGIENNAVHLGGLQYVRAHDGEALSAVAQHRTDRLGGNTIVDVTETARLDTTWQSQRGANVSVTGAGEYLQARVTAQQGYSFATGESQNGMINATGGYNYVFSPVATGGTAVTADPLGTLSGNLTRGIDVNAARTVRATLNASAMGGYLGRDRGTTGTVGGQAVLMSMLGANTSINGSVSLQRAFGTDQSIVFAQSAEFSAALDDISTQTTIAHNNRSVYSRAYDTQWRTATEEIVATQTLSAVVPATRVLMNVRATARWEVYALEHVGVECNAVLPRCLDCLNGTASYSLLRDMRMGISTHRVQSSLWVQVREMTITAQYSFVREAQHVWSELYITLARPFKVM